ncbi:MAG TPA: DUF4402 domain-containing protein [Holophagaceae bacterium]|nr:DUF4402 domain-containing protein [Holophagaceae bacterium]
MRTRSLLAFAIAGSAFAAAPNSPQAFPTASTGVNTATMTAIPVTARIFKPITLTGVTGLDFGAMVQTDPASASTLTFTPGATAGAFSTASSNMTTFASTGVTPSVAEITVNGSANKAINVTLSANSVTLAGGLSGTVTVNPLKISASGAASADSNAPTAYAAGSIGAGGSTFVNVGGQLNVSAGSEGTFTGSFDMTVAYQ